MAFLDLTVFPNNCSETLPDDFLTNHDMNIVISTKFKEIKGDVRDMFIVSYHIDGQLREVAKINIETHRPLNREEIAMFKDSCLVITEIERKMNLSKRFKRFNKDISIFATIRNNIDCSLLIENKKLIDALKRAHKNKNSLDNANILEDNTMENINNFNTATAVTPTPPATDDNEYRNNKIFSLPLICNKFSVRMAYEIISKKEVNIKTFINNRCITGHIDDIAILNNIPMIRIEFSTNSIFNEEIEYIRNSYVTIDQIDIFIDHIVAYVKFDRELEKCIKDAELINAIKEKNRILNSSEISEVSNTGEGFAIYRTYPSVKAMEADANNVATGKIVLITSEPEDPDNARLYVKNNLNAFTFLMDMSGVQGIKPEENESELLEVMLCTYSKSLSKYQTDSIAEFALKKCKEDLTKIGYVTIIDQKNAHLKSYGDESNNFLSTSTYKIEDYDNDNNSLKLKPIRVRSQYKPYIISVIGIIMHEEDIEFRCVEIVDENKRLVSETLVPCL